MGAFDGFSDNSPNFSSWLQQLLGSLQNRPQSGNYMSQLQPMLGGNTSPTPPNYAQPQAGGLGTPPGNALPGPPPNPPATASPPPNPPAGAPAPTLGGAYAAGNDPNRSYTQVLGRMIAGMS